MLSDIDELNEVVAALQQGKTATPVTIRSFLDWFDAKRRTSANVDYINKQLEKVGVRTIPDYLESPWVETPIAFEFVSHSAGEQHRSSSDPDAASGDAEQSHDAADDPSYKVGRVPSAKIFPICVNPNATLLEATTIMHLHNFSQLPVMTSERELKGVVSWESIGARSVTNISGPDVRAYMDEAYEVPDSASLFEAIKVIVARNYVLIRASDRKISGIVTATDIALQFEEISTPFLLIGEIENGLRRLVSANLTPDDAKKTIQAEYLPKEFSKISQLTFGNFVKLLDHPENWSKLGLQLDRVAFCKKLTDINNIRNDVMHFDPDPLSHGNMAELRNTSRFLEFLRRIGVS